ncbi:ribonuclease P protein component [Spiroplasma platyhelix]|uniref:Ribonuclease P protein component n=1 Tax=Spiroplasma platyhelix PALS-1 TaxID=1276218 RepID=A0A846U0K4_9MOLU|nr:ribonuclease P protein component [Spiroplasma platyhelix]MBE4704181.1 Ribonuclease P protein component [Spiroplasma platyhelix PALS-1]NKE38554.1 ribonuclease P protein component [Spiroplasma platyhelix PALS-1]UJB29439.1 ribonuclease P protein component [Spiroplasma platyhelix PALS-1]
MKKKYRLLKNYQFEKLIVNGKYVSNQEFFIYYFYRNDKGTIRVGISVPKKRVNKAFIRNKIKRQIKHMLNDVKKEWSIDIVVMVKKNYLNNDYNTNKISLLNLLKKVSMKEENK